jgi:hypothetical protein
MSTKEWRASVWGQSTRSPHVVPDNERWLVSGDCDAPNVLKLPFPLAMTASAESAPSSGTLGGAGTCIHLIGWRKAAHLGVSSVYGEMDC